MKHLKNHLQEDPSQDDIKKDDMILKTDVIKSSKVLDLSCRKLNTLPLDMITFCKQSTALVLNLSKNSLNDLPTEY
jgi:hypothetical protein